MMLKRNIKIILVGLSTVVFFGLMYILFGTKSEIIADESLRVEEPVIPGLESQLERAAKASMSRPGLKDSAEIELSLEDKVVDQPMIEAVGDLAESSDKEPATAEPDVLQKNDLAQFTNPFSDKPQLVEKDGDIVPSRDEFITFDAVVVDTDTVEVESSDTVELKDIDALEVVEEQEGDVAIIPEEAGFLNLNEATSVKDVTPIKQEMVLLEVDQLIFDEINRGLSKYNLHGSNDSDAEVAAANDEGKAIEPNPKELVKSGGLQRDKKVTASDKSLERPSVFAMPDIDESLMQGDNEISQQYRVTMSKLISINAKLQAADEENAELRTQFEISVSQNRQMAQIIRDIDNQIKAFTLTN